MLRTNQYGFALMQVLIAIPIVAIISLVIATMMSTFSKQNRELSQKLDTLEFKQLFTPIVADDDRCTKMLQGISVNVGSNPSAKPSSLKSSPTGTVLITANAALPGTMSGVRVGAIELRDFAGTGTANEYNMNIRINWDASSLIMSLQPITIGRVVTVDPSTQKITSCHAVSGGGGGPTGPCTSAPGTSCVNVKPKGATQGTYTCTCASGGYPVWCEVKVSYTSKGGSSDGFEPGTLTATGCTFKYSNGGFMINGSMSQSTSVSSMTLSCCSN